MRDLTHVCMEKNKKRLMVITFLHQQSTSTKKNSFASKLWIKLWFNIK